MNTMYQDVNGKESSKRRWASRYLTVGLVMAGLWFALLIVVQFTKVELKISFPWEIWYGVVGFGAAILGVTIFEKKNV